MIIESVEMENFKSYSKRVFVKLKKGFTVIIGPNGSGKSNLGDAMLFVLGAKSNKAIRVDKAADFIHKSEPQIKRCSVTLTILSNENRYLLTREVINNGNEVKSNYYINKKRARYNDVFKLIDSFHIYLDSYSFVLQGDINNLIKMSGSERRKLFESMAGIESYKERIENAKNDITGLNENINILSANLSSIKGYLDKLDIDRQNARKYSDLKREIDEMDAYLKMKDKEKLDSEISLYEENIKKLSSEIEQFTEKKQLFDKEKIEKNEEIKEIEEKLDKLGGKEVKEIRESGELLKNTMIAAGLSKEVKFIWADELVSNKDYWELLLNISKNSSLSRIRRSLPIMGRTEEDADRDFSKYIYPLMQVTDIMYLDLDFALGGMDQRHAHMLQRDIGEHMNAKKVISVHMPLLPGLKGSGRMDDFKKMSKSDPDSAIFITDSDEDITRKIKNAYCPIGIIENNPLISILKSVVFPYYMDEITINRPESKGGSISVGSRKLVELYGEQKIHPVDLKNAVTGILIDIIDPIREKIKSD